MAVKMIILSIIAGIILLLTLDSIPGNEAYNTCLSQMRTNYNTVLNYVRDRKWSQNRSCLATFEQVQSDIQCIESVNQSYITARYIFWLSQYRPQINSIIRKHNQYCIDLEIPLYEINIPSKSK